MVCPAFPYMYIRIRIKNLEENNLELVNIQNYTNSPRAIDGLTLPISAHCFCSP